MTALARLLLLFSVSLLLAACGGGGGGGSTPTPTPPVTVTVTAVSPLSVRAGDTLVITGTGLAGVASVRIGGALATLLTRSATVISVRVPAGITQGAIELVLSDGSTQAVSQALTILPTPVISGFSPASGTVGTPVTVTGSALDAVDRVQVGLVSVTIQSRSADSLSFTVPAGAVDAVITLFAGTAQISSSAVFDVVSVIAATGFSPASGPAGSVVTVSGSGLDDVTGVTIGGSAMTVVSKSATQLLFVAQASGSIVLAGPGGQSVPVGSFTVDAFAVPAVTLTRIDVAQTYAQQTGTAYQRLSPGKPAVVRAYVHGSAAIASPAVSLVVQRNGSTLGTLAMSGPPVLPQLPQSTLLNNTFNATLPADWVGSGLTLAVTVASSNPTNSGAALSVSPQVGSKKVAIDLVVVPITVASTAFGGKATAITPLASEIKTRLQRAFPFDASRIAVTVRPAAHDLSGTISRTELFSSNEVTRREEWSDALEAVETLRDREAPSRHYYGLLPGTGFVSGTVGLGYLNRPASSYQPSAIGLDSAVDFWLDTLVHELGHNFSLEHAPCGGVSDPDGSYPYPQGRLGSTPVYDNVALVLIDPQDLTHPYDVMGYCDGQWFSDYNYDKAQRFQETLPSAQAAVYSQPQELLSFRGALAADGSVTLQPVSAQTGTQRPVQRAGEYRLLLTLEDGRVLSEPIAPTPVADGAEGLLHFKATLVNPGRVTAVAVARSGAERAARVRMPAGVAAAQVGVEAAAVDRTPRVAVSEQNGQATLRWDATVWPVLTVRHAGAGGTTVLAAQLSAGTATLDTARLPAGGRFEFSLSDGLNARAVSVAR